MTTKKDLHTQAGAIDKTLARHKIPATVAGGSVQPHLVQFRLSNGHQVDVRAVEAISGEIARELDVASCPVYVDAGHIIIEAPRSWDRPILELLDLTDRLRGAGHDVPPMTAVLGLARDGVPLLLRLSSPNVQHVLVAGQAGAGKTALLRTMIASLSMHNSAEALQMAALGRELRGLLPPVSGTEAALLATTAVIMERRQAGELPAVPRLVLFLDDLDGRPDLLYSHVRQILEHGAAAGIHVVASVTDALPAEIASLVPLFPIAIQGQAPPGAHIARTNDGQESRLYSAGDFLVVTRRGDVARMAAAYIDESRIPQLEAGMPQRHLRLMSVSRIGGQHGM